MIKADGGAGDWRFMPGDDWRLEDVAEVQRLVDGTAFSTALQLMQDNFLRAQCLLEWSEAGVLPPEAAPTVLHEVWTGSKTPAQYLDINDWVALFRRHGEVAQAGPLVVYRGAGHPYLPGMSWTTDVGVASRFAEAAARWADAATYKTVVDQEAVLAVYDSALWAGDEREVVVDPSALGRVEVVDVLPMSDDGILAAQRLAQVFARPDA